MSTSDRRIGLGALAAIGVAIAGGLVWIGQMSQSVTDTQERLEKVEQELASDEIEGLEGRIDAAQVRIDNLNENYFAKLPIGSIIPFVGELKDVGEFSQWKLCDGSILQGEKYRDSPFYNRNIPQLDGVFLRGTVFAEHALTFGGAASHAHTQPHTHELSHRHSGRTEDGEPKNAAPADHHHEGGNHTHKFTTSFQDSTTTTPPSAGKTEMGTSIPPYIGVFYLIKVL